MDSKDHAKTIREQAEAAGAFRDPRHDTPLTAVRPDEQTLAELRSIRGLLEDIKKDVAEIKTTIQEWRTR